MDGVIYEIPRGRPWRREQFHEQNVIGLVGRGYTVFGEGAHTSKVEWGEAASLRSDECSAPALQF